MGLRIFRGSRGIGLAVAAALLLPRVVAGQQYRFDVYDHSKGLTNVQVHSVAFDKDGFLWIATRNGVFRFLGSRFEHFGPESGFRLRGMEKIFVDEEGRVWASTSENLYLWRSKRFEPANAVSFEGVQDLLSAGKDRLFLVKSGHLEDATLNAAGTIVASKPFFSAAQQSIHPELEKITSIARAKDGALWMGCGTGICSLRNEELRFWGPNRGVPSQVARKLYIAREGSLWIQTSGGIFQLPANGSSFKDRTPPATISNRYFIWNSIIEDRLGRILVNSASGLERWDGSAWQTIGPANGFNNSTATSLAVDLNGDVWIGSLRGVWHWTGYQNWETWTEAQGLPSSGIWSVHPAPDGEVYVGTIKGPAVLNLSGRGGRLFSSASRWRWGQVSGIDVDRAGMVWMITFAGEVLRSDSRFTSVRQLGNIASFTNQLRAAENGNLWIAGISGIYVFETKGNSPALKQDLDAAALLGKEPGSLSITPGAEKSGASVLWVSTSHKLIARQNGQWTSPRIAGLALEKISIWETAEGRDGTLFLFGEDESKALGLWRLKRNGDARLDASRVPLPNELNGRLPFAILVDSRGWLWLGTDNGVVGWNGSQWRTWTRESGLIFDDVNRNVMREAPDGSIWIGTPAGLAHLMRADEMFAPVSLPLKITDVQINGNSAKEADAGDLPWEGNRFRFQFSSPAMWNRTTLSFQYRLLGLDAAWTSTQNTDATFSNLPPGSYRFQVFAQNPSLGARSELSESAFRILPPWWRTWWFYLICGVAAGALIWLLLRLRTRQIQARRRDLERTVQEMWAETHRLAERAQDATMAEERNRLAHELHDSLAASFTAIYSQLQAATDLAANGDNRSYACVSRAEELSRSGLQHVREFAQSLIARSDEPAPTVSGLRELVAFATTGTSVAGTFEVEGHERPLTPACALALARILQEAVGNAQRYARARDISVTLRFEERMVSLTIQDNGKGFRVDKMNDGGFGLAGMRARAVRLSGRFDLQSSPGKGTRIIVEIPDPYTQEHAL